MCTGSRVHDGGAVYSRMMRGAALLVVCCACLDAQTAAFEGVVVNQATGEPMAGAHIRLTNAVNSSAGQPYGAMSDRAGRFSIASLPAGTYIIEAKQRGFLCMPPKEGDPVLRVSLKAAQQLTDFKIEMAQEATISGRVMDDDGDPVAANVHADAESARMMNYGRGGESDERGEFQISVAPGKYYIVADPPGRGVNQEPEIRTDGSVDAVYGTTYYPGSASKARGTLVEAAAGAQITGIDIHLARQPRGVSIRGAVSGAPDGSGGSMVMLFEGDDPWHAGAAGATGAGVDGHFQFVNLQPGAYRLFALWFGKPRLYSLPLDLRLEGGDVTGVNLALAPGAEITGKLEMAGGAGTDKLSVDLQPMEYGFMEGSTPSGEVDASGVFRISDVAPRRYRVGVQPLPENAYLKSVRLDGAEAADGRLDLSRGAQGSSLRIVVSRNGGQVSGKLLDQNGEPVGTVPLMVLVAADGQEIDVDRSAITVEDGTYRFQGLRPGKYRLLAFDRFQFGAEPDFREAVKKLAAGAEEIEIKEGDRKVKDLKLAAKQDADTRPRQ